MMGGLSLLALSPDCRAEASGGQKAKGIVGGALIGAEVVSIVEAAAGVQPGWAYIVGGAVGAGGGAFAGYYIADSTSSTKPTSFLLAGGIALGIPAVIAVVSATQFHPPASYRQDAPPVDDEDAPFEAPLPETRLDLPQVSVAHAFTPEEQHKYGVAQATEVHLSVLRGAF